MVDQCIERLLACAEHSALQVVMDIFQYRDLHVDRFAEVLKAARQTLVQMFRTLCKIKARFQLPQTTLVDLLSSDGLNVENENLVAQFALEWMEHCDCYTSEVCKTIRWSNVTDHYFAHQLQRFRRMPEAHALRKLVLPDLEAADVYHRGGVSDILRDKARVRGNYEVAETSYARLHENVRLEIFWKDDGIPLRTISALGFKFAFEVRRSTSEDATEPGTWIAVVKNAERIPQVELNFRFGLKNSTHVDEVEWGMTLIDADARDVHCDVNDLAEEAIRLAERDDGNATIVVVHVRAQDTVWWF